MFAYDSGAASMRSVISEIVNLIFDGRLGMSLNCSAKSPLPSPESILVNGTSYGECMMLGA